MSTPPAQAQCPRCLQWFPPDPKHPTHPDLHFCPGPPDDELEWPEKMTDLDSRQRDALAQLDRDRQRDEALAQMNHQERQRNLQRRLTRMDGDIIALSDARDYADSAHKKLVGPTERFVPLAQLASAQVTLLTAELVRCRKDREDLVKALRATEEGEA